jgi:hypothetical protein
MPGPSEDVPRWQPPTEPSEEVARWEPSAEVPRWNPTADVPRWQPPAAGVAGARLGEDPGPRRPLATRVSPLAWPFAWWRAHPWAVVWAGVFLVPAGVLLLRAADESGFERYVTPLQWTLIAFFVLVVVRGVLFSARRSIVRLALGVLAVTGATGLLLWPATRVTLGRVTCPARAGSDLGVAAAATAIEAWQRGEPGAEAWRAGEASGAWRGKAQAISLLDYQLVETGCFERVAPIDGRHTWHDFRVTVKEGARAPLSKIVTVHTVAEGDGWRITAIEGPLP